MGARTWPSGCLCRGPDYLGCGTRFAQTVLAPQIDFGTAAQPRPKAPGNKPRACARDGISYCFKVDDCINSLLRENCMYWPPLQEPIASTSGLPANGNSLYQAKIGKKL